MKKSCILLSNTVMASNFFGQIFRITTFGESHGIGIGVVIDGCPSNIPITEEEINLELMKRRPGMNAYTSPRKEKDQVQILSGVYEGKTTGAPIALLIPNEGADSAPYAGLRNVYRPGHANFTYLQKYGIFDERGGGRASARETAARVAAGAVAKKLLGLHGIDCVAFVSSVGDIALEKIPVDVQRKRDASPIFCPDEEASLRMQQLIDQVRCDGDSIGGVASCVARVPVGLGDPVYHKLEAMLACAMLSIPATKGFEIGAGFEAAKMRGSEHNDAFDLDADGNVCLASNRAGGTLGGISSGEPLFFRVAFKPPSSIKKAQSTVSLSKEKISLELPPNAKHDPCVAIRGVPVVEAMTALVLADALLMNQLFSLHSLKGG